MHTRRTLRCGVAIALTLTLSGLAACGGDDGGGGADDPDGFTYEAARLCSDVINDRDHAVAEAGRDASFDVVASTFGGGDIDPAGVDQAIADMSAYRDLLIGTRDRLARLEADDDATSDAWNAVVASGDAKVALLERRIAALETVAAGGEVSSADLDLGGGEPDHEVLGPALEQLELVGRDCEGVFGALGNPDEYATFLDAATSTCTTIVSRRRAEGFSTDLILGVVQQVWQEEPVTVTPELIAEVHAVAAEWALTAEEVEAVPTDDVPDAEAWADVRAAVAERVDVFERRAAALESGDEAQIVALFTPRSVYQYPGLGDFPLLGLDTRDCRSLTA